MGVEVDELILVLKNFFHKEARPCSKMLSRRPRIKDRTR